MALPVPRRGRFASPENREMQRLEHGQRIVRHRTEQQLRIAEMLHLAGAGMTDTLQAARNSKESLLALESRLLRLRGLVHHDTGVSSAAREEPTPRAYSPTRDAAARGIEDELTALLQPLERRSPSPPRLPPLVLPQAQPSSARPPQRDSDDEMDGSLASAPSLFSLPSGRSVGDAGMIKSGAAGPMSTCPSCSRRYAAHRFDRHYAACLARHAGAAAIGPQAERPMLPYPPTNVHVVAVTGCSIALAWQPPMLDGGAYIRAYEVGYTAMLPATDDSLNSQYIPTPQDIVSTAAISPTVDDVSRADGESDVALIQVAPRGTTLLNLRALTTYVDIRVRAVNAAGVSTWSASMAPVRTLSPIAPSPPSNLHVLEVAANSVTLSWTAPVSSGGRTIARYDVTMYETPAGFAVDAASDAARRKRVRHTAEGDATTAIVSGLRSDTVYTDVHVQAVNSADLRSDASEAILSLRTAQLPRREFLVQELARMQALVDEQAQAQSFGSAGDDSGPAAEDEAAGSFGVPGRRDSTANGVHARNLAMKTAGDDVEVFYSRSFQRMRRHRYIQMLKQQLEALDAAAGALVSDVQRDDSPRAVARSASPVGDDTAVASRRASTRGVDAAAIVRAEAAADHAREVTMRRGQFHARIAFLRDRVTALEADEKKLGVHKHRLGSMLDDLVTRRRVVVAELEFARTFDGDQLESSALSTDRKQLFETAQLVGILTETAQKLSVTLSTVRGIVGETTAELDAVVAALARTRDELAARQHALGVFERDEHRRTRIIARLGDVSHDWKRRCFEEWKRSVRSADRGRKAFIHAVLRWTRPALARAWSTWVAVMRSARMHDASAAALLDVTSQRAEGMGSIVLAEAERMRFVITDDVTATMAWVHQLQRDVSTLTATNEDRARVVVTPSQLDAMTHLPPAAEAKRVAQVAALSAGDTYAATAPLDAVRGPAGKGASSKPGVSETSNPEAAPPSSTWAQLAHASPSDAMSHHLVSLLEQASAYLHNDMHAQAFAALRRAEVVYGYLKDAAGLLATYRLLSRLMEALHRMDVAAVHWGRCVQMAKQLGHHVAQAEAQEGLARVLSAVHDSDGAVRALLDAAGTYEMLRDHPSCVRVYRALRTPLDALHREGEAVEYERRAQALQSQLPERIRGALDKLDHLRAALVQVGLGEARSLSIEACSPAVPLLRRQTEVVGLEVVRMQKEKADVEAANASQLTALQAIDDELRLVRACTAPMFTVRAPPGSGTRLLPAEGAIDVLEQYRTSIQADLTHIAQLLVDAQTRCTNAELAAAELQAHLATELGPLATQTYRNRQLRYVAANVTNFRVNDVLGAATGGLPLVAIGLDTCVLLHSAFHGLATHCITWSRKPASRDAAVTDTHTGVLTCIAYIGTCVFTGATDGRLCAWDVTHPRRWDGRSEGDSPFEWDVHRRAEDARNEALPTSCVRAHDGTVLCVAATGTYVVTGGADMYMCVWTPDGATAVRRIRAHEQSVTVVAGDDDLFATGSTDRTVRTWRVERSAETGATAVSAGWRLDGHSGTVTAICVVGTEVISGSASGEIIIWNAINGSALRRHQLFPSSVSIQLLQFDSVKVVAYGANDRLIIADVLSGFVYQDMSTPHGGAQVLGLQFDTDKVLTIATDRSMHVYSWKSDRIAGAPPELMPRPREHVVRRHQQLGAVAALHGVTVGQLMEWNTLRAAHAIYPGLRLALYPPSGALTSATERPSTADVPLSAAAAVSVALPSTASMQAVLPAAQPRPQLQGLGSTGSLLSASTEDVADARISTLRERAGVKVHRTLAPMSSGKLASTRSLRGAPRTLQPLDSRSTPVQSTSHGREAADD